MELESFFQRFDSSVLRRVKSTQTTYLELELKLKSDGEELYRLHFDGKQEFYLERRMVRSVSVEEAHPLLIDYCDETVDVHLDGLVERIDEFADELTTASRRTFGGWRNYERYLNMPLALFLEKPYGLLLTAPESFAKEIINLGPKFGVNLFTRNRGKPKGDFKALLLDDLFVIAREFRVQLMLGREHID